MEVRLISGLTGRSRSNSQAKWAQSIKLTGKVGTRSTRFVMHQPNFVFVPQEGSSSSACVAVVPSAFPTLPTNLLPVPLVLQHAVSLLAECLIFPLPAIQVLACSMFQSGVNCAAACWLQCGVALSGCQQRVRVVLRGWMGRHGRRTYYHPRFIPHSDIHMRVVCRLRTGGWML